MTGKELVLFILNHDLLDVEIGTKITSLFLTVEEAAVKLGISKTSLLDMIKLGVVDSITFNETIYVSKDIELTSLKTKKQVLR